MTPVPVNGNVLYMFEYNLTDHLGNVRVTFGGHSNSGPEVLQVTDYDPFGLVMAQQNYVGAENALPNKYLYNGKELQDDVLGGTALDWYDYGARMYDPVIGRWHTIDPLAEVSRRWSPYSYCYNNPMRFIDPDGMEAEDPNNKDKIQVNAGISKSSIAKQVMAEVGLNIKTPKNSTPKELEQIAAHNEKQAEIRKDIKNGVKDVTSKTANASVIAGTAVQLTGYVGCIFVGPGSLALVGVGKAIEAPGTFINNISDLSEDKVGKFAANTLAGAAFGSLTNNISSMKNAGNLTQESAGILQFFTDAYHEMSRVIIDAVSDRNNERK